MPRTKVLSTEGWPTKEQAAERCLTSTKSIERLAAQGKLRQAWRPVDGRKDVRVYNPDDVQRIREQRLADRRPELKGEASGTALATTAGAAPPALRLTPELQALVSVLATAIPAASVAPPSLWLTLEQAAAWTGIMKAEIHRAVHAKPPRLTSHPIGPRGSLAVWHEDLLRFAQSYRGPDRDNRDDK